MFPLQAHFQTDNKFCAFTVFRMNLDGAAHHIYDVFGNSHTKTCTLNFADGGGTLTFKWIKNFLCELPAHSNTSIFHTDFVQAFTLYGMRNLRHPNGYGSSSGSKLYRIGYQIHEYLI